jgi:glutaredoxin 3
LENRLAKVEIYTKMMCGFATAPDAGNEEVAYEEYAVDFGGSKGGNGRASGRTDDSAANLHQRAPCRGCDELMSLEYQGKLDELLAVRPGRVALYQAQTG